MPGFIDHNLLCITQCLSHVFLFHLLVIQFIPVTLSQEPFMFWVDCSERLLVSLRSVSIFMIKTGITLHPSLNPGSSYSLPLCQLHFSNSGICLFILPLAEA